VLWFGTEVWPRIRAARPDARFIVVGSSPTRAIRGLAVTDPSIEVAGSVPAVQPYLHRAAVSVAPLRLARGVQTKVIEALAAGLPVVVTPVVSKGLPAEALPGCLQPAEDPDEFAKAVLDLLAKSPAERRQRAAAARLESLAWTQQIKSLKQILDTAIAG
jgi:polysaccharide biosynthesis protein PslH